MSAPIRTAPSAEEAKPPQLTIAVVAPPATAGASERAMSNGTMPAAPPAPVTTSARARTPCGTAAPGHSSRTDQAKTTEAPRPTTMRVFAFQAAGGEQSDQRAGDDERR